MRPAVTAAVIFLWAGAAALPARGQATPGPESAPSTSCPVCPVAECPPNPEGSQIPVDDPALPPTPPWHTVWGVTELRIIPDGLRTGPDGGQYHPNFTIDFDFNFWLWRGERLYVFGDASLWGERSEDGVTNAKDGFWGTSKREFDVTGGAAWNYAGYWEARAFGYSYSNLNRGISQVTPSGFNDGAGLENRYYLSSEYAKLGQPGFDVTRADFLSVGYYPTKVLVGNDGQEFKPGLFLRAYLTCDLGQLPFYLYADTTFVTEQSLKPKLLLFDLGLAGRPFRCLPQCEFRLGAENTGDLEVKDVQSLLYISVRYVF
jgi:hypothetical protein